MTDNDHIIAWVRRGSIGEMHMRTAMAKLKGAEFAFSDKYQPRTHYLNT